MIVYFSTPLMDGIALSPVTMMMREERNLWFPISQRYLNVLVRADLSSLGPRFTVFLTNKIAAHKNVLAMAKKTLTVLRIFPQSPQIGKKQPKNKLKLLI